MKRKTLILILILSITIFLSTSAQAQDPNDPGDPDTVWLSRVPMSETCDSVLNRPMPFAVVCSASIVEYLAGITIPISFYHSQNLDITADSIEFSTWFTDIYPSVLGSTCHNDSVGSSEYSPKSFLAGGVWFNATQGQCFPPGRGLLFKVYFNRDHLQVPNWDTTKSIVLDSFLFRPPAPPNEIRLEFWDTLAVVFTPVFRYGTVGDTVTISGIAYKSDGVTPDSNVLVYCRGKDVYRDTFYFAGRVLEDITDGSGNFRFMVGKGGYWCVFRDTTGGLVPDENAYCFDPLISDLTEINFINFKVGSIRAGNTNADSLINLSDVVYIARYKLFGGDPPEPLESGDVNCDGEIELDDAVYLANYLLKSGPLPCCYFRTAFNRVIRSQ